MAATPGNAIRLPDGRFVMPDGTIVSAAQLPPGTPVGSAQTGTPQQQQAISGILTVGGTVIPQSPPVATEPPPPTDRERITAQTAEDTARVGRLAAESEAAIALLKGQAIEAQTPRTAPVAATAQIGPTETVKDVATVGPIAPVAAGTVDAARIDTGREEQIRREQTSAIGDIRAAARGEVPSAADIQTKAAVERAIANQFSAATAAQGRSVGGALRGATEGAAAQVADIESQGAARRAAEQEAARGLLVTATGQARGQDIGQAQAQAQLDQQASIVNQDAGLRAQVANQSTELQRQGLNAQEANKIAMQNVIQLNQGAIAQAQLKQQTNLANQAATIQQLNLDDEKQLGTARNLLTGLATSGQLATLPINTRIAIETLLLDEGFRRDQLAIAIKTGDRDFMTKLIGVGLTGLGVALPFIAPPLAPVAPVLIGAGAQNILED